VVGNEIGRYYEDFKPGAVIEHAMSKTVFESDNNLFCLLTMNPHPLHTNVHYAERTEFGQPLVVGTLVFSLVVGMTVMDVSGKAVANLGYEAVEHLAPVFVGDTLYARTEVLSCRESRSRPNCGIVAVETTAWNQDKTDVLRLRRTILVPKRRGDGG